MTEHNIFYYPYASFKDKQSPLLKAVALYFDKLYILDPLKSNWGHIGQTPATPDINLLEQEGILVRVSPEEVLHTYEAAIADAIRADVNDPDFLEACERSGRAGLWTLALAKVPKVIRHDPKFQPLDRAMQHLMGDIAREVSADVGRYVEEYAGIADGSDVYDEYRETDIGVVEYRYADYPLPVGEAIMINHALFGGLMYTGATPLTDDPFHNEVLNLKINRARQIPEVRDILEQRAKQHQLKRDYLAMATLTDIDLEIISPQMPLQEILEYRSDNKDQLQRARENLGWLSREIRNNPWSRDFADDIESNAIPKIHNILEEAKKSRDSWLKSDKVKKVLKIIGIAAGAAATTLSLVLSAFPLMPVGVAIGALGMTGNVAVPGAALALDWKQGKKEATKNGLHYLLSIKK